MFTSIEKFGVDANLVTIRTIAMTRSSLSLVAVPSISASIAFVRNPTVVVSRIGLKRNGWVFTTCVWKKKCGMLC